MTDKIKPEIESWQRDIELIQQACSDVTSIRSVYNGLSGFLESDQTTLGAALQASIQLVCLHPGLSLVEHFIEFPESQSDAIEAQRVADRYSHTASFPTRLVLRLKYYDIVGDTNPLQFGASWLFRIFVEATQLGRVQIAPMEERNPYESRVVSVDTTFYSIREGEEILNSLASIVPGAGFYAIEAIEEVIADLIKDHDDLDMLIYDDDDDGADHYNPENFDWAEEIVQELAPDPMYWTDDEEINDRSPSLYEILGPDEELEQGDIIVWTSDDRTRRRNLPESGDMQPGEDLPTVQFGYNMDHFPFEGAPLYPDEEMES